MYGTCLIVTQNFAVSGANQVRELSARKVTYMDASTVDHALQVTMLAFTVVAASSTS
ncbi:hypothetical protein Pmar_PMAR026592 [Perkinsus marinus ATCC 50983]|uniref:Uncharacterized protein n=1 Tax=Perkinsus marinus (strain ATCC 50983 / TXsc) TaxID=423536 RepID=C5LDZ4_PERM5|nr:hypothetical protein Pmar_PMAR026592 [Perkinsus marinus ATCC 50983]EER05158.1 hypothetical protein Pmar_PMAR026592 [Perkinsus marinus ATCC 50983]|eukprot:XP_002773342.1 hypothetical protein Pmar_PMAR026592 [Perkinsus marinus ATCC 50983]